MADFGKAALAQVGDLSQSVNTQLSDIAIQIPVSNGIDDTDIIQSYLNLGKQQKRKVMLKPNQTYLVSRKGTKAIRDTIYSYTYGYSLIVPNGVKFDLNGSTIKLKNGQDSLILLNENPDATSDATACVDENIHVTNGILDQNNANQTSTYYQGGIYFAKVKNGSLTNLKVINARIDGFRIMGCRNCHFDKLYAKDIQGHGFYIGRKDSTGYDLCLYDCTFGIISGENCITGFWNPPADVGTQNDGNSIHFMAANTTVDTMIDKNTTLGIKIAGGSAGGSKELQIAKIIANGSPVKFQHVPQRVQVGLIDVSNSPTWAVAMIDPNNLQIGKINCYNCFTTDDSAGQVVLCNGTNVTIDDIMLDSCLGGQSVLFQLGSDKYNVKNIRVTNCKGSIEIPSNGTITLGDVSVIKDPAMAADNRGINISGSTAKVHIHRLSLSGNFKYGDYLVSQASKNVKIESITKEGVNESGRTITLVAGASTTISGSSLNYLYKVYGSTTILPIIRFIPVSATSAGISISRYKINSTTFDLTIYHSTAVGTEQFIMDIKGYTASDVQLN